MLVHQSTFDLVFDTLFSLVSIPFAEGKEPPPAILAIEVKNGKVTDLFPIPLSDVFEAGLPQSAIFPLIKTVLAGTKAKVAALVAVGSCVAVMDKTEFNEVLAEDNPMARPDAFRALVVSLYAGEENVTIINPIVDGKLQRGEMPEEGGAYFGPIGAPPGGAVH